MSQSLKFEYNINGVGNVGANFTPVTTELFTDKFFNLENKLRNINQLGAIKYLHLGAHFTRYEYVLLQVYLLKLIADETSGKQGLSSRYHYSINYYKNKLQGYSFTTMDIVQLTIIMANMGHFQNTFSSNKVLYEYIVNDKNGKRKVFLKGLDGTGKQLFLNFEKDITPYNIQWFISLFQLSRKEKYEKYKLVCEYIINILMSKEKNFIKDVYNKIRLIAYTVLDTHFSGLPITIDLRNIIIDTKYLSKSFFNHNSNLINTLKHINDLLEDSLYLENNALLINADISKNIDKEITEFIESQYNSGELTKFKNLIFNSESPLNIRKNKEEYKIKWVLDKNLSITVIRDREDIIRKSYSFESKVHKQLGEKIYFAYNFSPDTFKSRYVYSIDNRLTGEEVLKACRKIIKNVYYIFSHEIQINREELSLNICKKTSIFFLRNILTEDLYCDFEYDEKISPFVVARGAKNALKEVEQYLEKIQTNRELNKGELHEINQIIEYLKKLEYKGLLVIYLGSLRFIDSESKSKCEIDGFIMYPNEKNKLISIFEAKSGKTRRSRASEAKKQMEAKLNPILKSFENYHKEYEKMVNFGCVLEINKKEV